MTGPTAGLYPPRGSGAVGRLVEALRQRRGEPATMCSLAREVGVHSSRIANYLASPIVRGLVTRERKPDGKPGWLYRAVLILAVAHIAPSVAHAHSWYSGLHNDRGVSCCNDSDCRPVEGCSVAGGGLGIIVGGKCWPVPKDDILPFPSPDGGLHGCYQVQPDGSPHFFCVIEPGSA
jgi:hypothetical protein